MTECQLSSAGHINSDPKTLSCTRHATEKKEIRKKGERYVLLISNFLIKVTNKQILNSLYKENRDRRYMSICR